MEIRASTIIVAKRKAKQSRSEEKELLAMFTRLQGTLRTNFNETTKIEMDRVKRKLAKIVANKTRGTIVRSNVRWYEFDEKNKKYFYNLEKKKSQSKAYNIIKKGDDGSVLRDPKVILEEKEEEEEEEAFFSDNYRSGNPKN